MRLARLLSAALPLALVNCALANAFQMPEGLTAVQTKRFKQFETFQIRGVCGDHDLDRLATFGVNTVRGYTIPNVKQMRSRLDEAHRLGIKVVVSEWMPHHGENKGKGDSTWKFDYAIKGDEMVRAFIEKVDGIGDHPAILMWGLGNEVHLDEPYLRVVNRMSLAIHERYPHHITSLTMVNAKPTGIEAVQKFAPDIDVLGIQSYSRGAVSNSIKQAETLWKKPFYLSEFNTNGPWNFGKTEWGTPLDEPVTKKVADLKGCYEVIDASKLCLGSTIFAWGHQTVGRPTYFSLLLDQDPGGPGNAGALDSLLITPQADVMIEHFTGKARVGNRAPALSKLEFDGGANALIVEPGQKMRIRFDAVDADRDRVSFVTWILDTAHRSAKRVGGPFSHVTAGIGIINAPKQPGEYALMVYAIDGKGGGSASTLNFKVSGPAPKTQVPKA